MYNGQFFLGHEAICEACKHAASDHAKQCSLVQHGTRVLRNTESNDRADDAETIRANLILVHSQSEKERKTKTITGILHILLGCNDMVNYCVS